MKLTEVMYVGSGREKTETKKLSEKRRRGFKRAECETRYPKVDDYLMIIMLLMIVAVD